MKKLLFLFPIVTLLAVSCNSAPQASNPSATPSIQTTPSTTNTTQINTSNWKTYTNTSDKSTLYPNGYAINYPADVTIKMQENFIADPYFYFPSSYFGGANITQATFAINETPCHAELPPSQQVILGGSTYSKSSWVINQNMATLSYWQNCFTILNLTLTSNGGAIAKSVENQFELITDQMVATLHGLKSNGPDTSKWSTFNSSQLGFQIKYPTGWTYDVLTDKSENIPVTSVHFYPPGKTAGYEYQGDIIIDTVANPRQLDLKTFYSDPQNNLVDGGTLTTLTNLFGYPEIKFTNIPAMVPSDQVSVNLGKTIVELVDVGQQHSDDGITNAMANSINKY